MKSIFFKPTVVINFGAVDKIKMQSRFKIFSVLCFDKVSYFQNKTWTESSLNDRPNQDHISQKTEKVSAKKQFF